MEALKERARNLVGAAPPQDSSASQPKEHQEIRKTIQDIGQRYNVLYTGLQVITALIPFSVKISSSNGWW